MQLTNQDFDDGFKNKRFELFYQPIISLSSPLVLAAEGVVRWKHPDYGTLNPALFLTQLDRLGRTGELTRYVFREAATACSAAQQNGLDISIGLNVLASDLMDGSLPASIGLLVEEFGISHHNLIVEVPHYPLQRPNVRFLQTMARLRDNGISTAAHLGVDVFTGDNALDLGLFSHLKIGIQAVLEIEARHKGPGVDLIMRFLNEARQKDVITVAVGAESATSLSSIDELGFTGVQGNYISPPISLDNAIDWLSTWSDVITEENYDVEQERSVQLVS